MKLFVDGGGNRRGNCYVGVAIYTGETLIFRGGSDLPHCSTNNEAEYVALDSTLRLLMMMTEKYEEYDNEEYDNGDIEIYMDSELVVKQVNGEYEVKAENLIPFHTSVKTKLEILRRTLEPDKVWLRNIPREQNKVADKAGREALEKHVESR